MVQYLRHICLILAFLAPTVFAEPLLPDSAYLLMNAYASTNVTTSAYVQLTAATTVPSTAVIVSDTSGKILKIAIGASGHEVDKLYIGPSELGVRYPLIVPKGSRISVKAIDASATTGYLLLSFTK